MNKSKSNPLTPAGKGWKEFMEPLGIRQKPKVWNPITGCPNLREWRSYDPKESDDYNIATKTRIIGCLTPSVDGVAHSYCYMADMMNRKLPHIPSAKYCYYPSRLSQPGDTKPPSIVAVGTAGDMWGWWDKKQYHENMEKVASSIKRTRHFYLFLTKFPQGYDWYINYLLKESRQSLSIPFCFSPIANMGFGVTITGMQDMERLNEFKYFCETYEHVILLKWIMIEPCFFTLEDAKSLPDDIFEGIDWVIIGSLTGRHAKKWRPKSLTLSWLVRKAKKAGAEVFLKDSLSDCFCMTPENREKLKAYPSQFYEWAEKQEILEAKA